MIKKGIIPEPQKVVIYGPQGVGKSSLAALFPNPLFLDTERGSRRLPVDRIEIETLNDFKAWVAKIPTDPEFKDYQTIVIDTIDWLEGKVKEVVVQEYSVKDRAYNREGSFIGDKMLPILNSLTPIITAGKNVVLLAHSATVKVDLPDQPSAFDRYELDMDKKYVAPLVKHWADHLLFLKNKIAIREVEEGKNKGVGKGDRILCTSTTASYDAKIRVPGALSVGEFPVKTPEEGIAIIKGIFESVGAPWGGGAPAQPAAALPEGKVAAPAKQEKAEPAPAKVPRDQEPGADDIPGIADPEIAEMEKLFAQHEKAVNAFLVMRGQIKEGQTFRDVSAEYRKRIIKSPVQFINAATAQPAAA